MRRVWWRSRACARLTSRRDFSRRLHGAMERGAAEGGAGELYAFAGSARRTRQQGGSTMGRTVEFLRSHGVGALAMLAAASLIPTVAAARPVRRALHPTGVA